MYLCATSIVPNLPIGFLLKQFEFRVIDELSSSESSEQEGAEVNFVSERHVAGSAASAFDQSAVPLHQTPQAYRR